MKYDLLYKYYYNDKDIYNEKYANRFCNDLCIHFDFNINQNPSFLLPTQEMFILLDSIYQNTLRLKSLKSLLPGIAMRQFAITCLIEEIKLTNDIEGVRSTRKEIQDIINSPQKAEKNKRLYGLVQKYILLENDTISIQTCDDIRGIYDELVSEEIKENNKDYLPDGVIFRKEKAFVQNEHMKPIHTGLYPEATLISAMEHALKVLDDTSLPKLIRIAIFHYMFGYIHPFYDGNGRTSRFISSYLLAQELDALVAYNLSYTIKHSIKEYYKSFERANDPINKGELTAFVTTFLEIIDDAIAGLNTKLSEKNEMFTHYQSIINKNQPFFRDDKTLIDVAFILLQNSLFGFEPITAGTIAKELGKSFATINGRLKILDEKGVLLTDIPHKYDINLNVLQELQG